MPTTVLIFAILGAATGSLYAIGSISLVLVYRSSGVLNFASGAFGMVGAFVYWELQAGQHWPAAPAIAAGIISAGLLGTATGLLMRPLRGASTLTKVVLTLAVLVVLEGLAGIRYPSGNSYLVSSLLPTRSVDILGAGVGADRLALIGISAVLTAACFAAYRFTRFGLATSATAENPEALATLGWSPGRVALINWAVGGVLSGVSGILLAPITGVSVALATALLLPSLAAAVVGNLQSVPWTFAGALLIGIVEAEVGRWVSFSGAGDAVPFAVVILIVMLRGRALPLRSYVTERLPRVATGRVNVPVLLGVTVVAAVLLEWVLSPTWVGAFTYSLIGVILMYSIVVVTGYSGQVSLAQWAIAGCGAMATAQLREHGVPWTLAVAGGLAAAIPIGLIVGAAAVRARGLSLAIATLAFSVCMVSLVLSNPSIDGGVGGVTVGIFHLFGADLDALTYPRRYALLCLALAVLIGLGLANLRRGNAGRRLLAVRSNENAAAALGIGVQGAKLAAFCYGSVLAALAGILTIAVFPAALFTVFDTFTSVQLVSNGVLGSVGYPSGALVGGAGQAGGVLPQLLSGLGPTEVQYLPVILGLLTIGAVIQGPDGIVAMNIELFQRVRGRLPGPRRRAAGPARTGGLVSRWARPARPVAVPGGERPVRAAPHSDPGPASLQVAGLSVTFGAVRAVDGVTFSLRTGQVLGVIGPNGAGKSTLIDAITGFAAADRGTVRLNGRPLGRLSPRRRALAGLSRSFQSLELFRDMTVYENLAAACDHRRWIAWLRDPLWPSPARLTPQCEAAVADLGLRDVLHAYPGELSYGRQRLVAIARTVASSPRIVLLDEPAAGLDEQERQEVRGVIRRLAHEWGLGVLLVEHDVGLVADVSDHLLALEFGRVVAYGQPDVVRSHPTVVAAYLGQDEAGPGATAGGPAPEQSREEAST